MTYTFNAMKRFFLSLAAVFSLAMPPALAAGDCPLCEVAASGDATEIRRLLAEGANPNAADNRGISALMNAAHAGRSETVKILLNAGANPNAAEKKYNFTALVFATSKNHPEVVKVLLDAGANPNWEDKFHTILMQATSDGQTKIVKMLLDAGADPNAEIEDSEFGNITNLTALHFTVAKKHSDIAIMLLDAGAKPNWTYILSTLTTGQTEVFLHIVKSWWEEE